MLAAVGKGVDLFISKNTLKNGYIHPAEKVDPRRLVHLGVSDSAFVAALYAILEPGGRVMIVTYFNRDDGEAAHRIGHALGWDQEPDGMNLENDLFGTYTLVTKPKWADRPDPR